MLMKCSFMEGARLRATVALFRDYNPSTPSGSITVQDGDSAVKVAPGRRVS